MTILRSVVGRCEECSRLLYSGDMGFAYDDGPVMCWEHSPTWNDLKQLHDNADAMRDLVDPKARRDVLDHIANGEGDRLVAKPL